MSTAGGSSGEALDESTGEGSSGRLRQSRCHPSPGRTPTKRVRPSTCRGILCSKRLTSLRGATGPRGALPPVSGPRRVPRGTREDAGYPAAELARQSERAVLERPARLRAPSCTVLPCEGVALPSGHANGPSGLSGERGSRGGPISWPSRSSRGSCSGGVRIGPGAHPRFGIA
jgi:hypothetical protein